MDPRQAGRPASNLQGAARKRWWRVTLADVPPNPYPSSLPCSSICSKPPTSPRLPPSFSKFLPRKKCGPYQQLNLCRLSELPEFLSFEIRCFQAAIVKGGKSQVRNMSFSSQNNSLGKFLPCDFSNIQRREILSRIYAGARNGMCVLRAPRIQPLSEI